MTEPTQAQPGELPPLPEPDCYAAMRDGKSVVIPPQDFTKYGSAYKLFTADQMREYTRAALASQATPGEWLKEAIDKIMTWDKAKAAVEHDNAISTIGVADPLYSGLLAERQDEAWRALLAHLANHPGAKT